MAVRRAPIRPRLQVSRTIPARRERVFEAWTNPADIARWWGRPDGVDMAEVDVDLRAGGSYRYVMEVASDGRRFPLSGKFIEVVPPERVVYTFSWEKEIPLPGGAFTGESRVTVEFRDAGDSTEIVLTHEGFPDDSVKDFHVSGWDASLDRLVALLEES